MNGEDLIVCIGRKKLISWDGELDPYQQRQDSPKEKKEKCCRRIPDANLGIVDG
jgi:hypothetical protein